MKTDKTIHAMSIRLTEKEVKEIEWIRSRLQKNQIKTIGRADVFRHALKELAANMKNNDLTQP